MKITTQSQAIDLLKNGKIQISCRSKVEADKVCALFPNSNNNYNNVASYFSAVAGKIDFGAPLFERPTLSAKRFLALPKNSTKKISEMPQVQRPIGNDVLQVRTPSLDGGWCVKTIDSVEYRAIMRFALKKDWGFNDMNGYYGVNKDGVADMYYDPANFNSNILTIPELKELIGYREEPIKVEDCVSGEWYIIHTNLCKWLIKFDKLNRENIVDFKSVNITSNTTYNNPTEMFLQTHKVVTLRPATREEVLKYFPNEFDAPKLVESLPEQRKIIGYLAPMDMYTTGNNIPVKKGTFGIKDFDNYCYSFNGWLFPAELVEAYFTPKYAETEADLITELINDFINHSNGQSLETFSKLQNKFTIKRKC